VLLTFVLQLAMNTQSTPVFGPTADRVDAMRLILRTADVAYCARPFAVSKQWSNRVTAEYFQQGDLEKRFGLSPSWFMNRDEPRVAECQVTMRCPQQCGVYAERSIVPRLCSCPTLRCPC
jgi:hypothetical protein